MEVEICRIHSEAVLPEYKTEGSACFDIAVIESKTLTPGEIADFRTGLVIRVPRGHVMILQARSSSPRLGYHLPHSVGIIDPDYCGPEDEVLLRLRNFNNRPITIKKHQRVVQGYIAPLPRVRWVEVKSEVLGKYSRGGFGSTGHH